jgi:hypothetical protein
MTDDEFEKATIARAMKGEAEAGVEALQIFIAGCDSGTLSRRILYYVRDRLVDIVSHGVSPDIASCLFKKRTRGVEYQPEEVAACYCLLLRKGQTPGKEKAALQGILVRGKKSISGRHPKTRRTRKM